MRFLFIFILVSNVFVNALDIYSENNEMDMNNQMFEQLDLPQNLIEENITNDIVTPVNEQNMSIAILLDKKKFFKFIPIILNSINAYMIKKDINYNIKLFDTEENLTQELNNITQNYKYIFTYFTNSDEVNILNNYPNNYFFIPTLNKNQVLNDVINNNIFFGGIDYRSQVSKLNQLISGKTMIIYEDRDLSKYITFLIKELLLYPNKAVKYPVYYWKGYNNKFIYLNTNIVNTVQLLANFTYNKVKTNAILSTQINYTPLIFSLTNHDDVENLILANSIFNIDPIIEDNNLNLNSDIDFNWLNYTTSVLLNKAYNLERGEDQYFLNDFNLHIFYNQVEYKTNLYKIFQNGFIQIEN